MKCDSTKSLVSNESSNSKKKKARGTSMTKRIRLEKCKGAAEREKIVGTGKEKKKFNTKLTEK